MMYPGDLQNPAKPQPRLKLLTCAGAILLLVAAFVGPFSRPAQADGTAPVWPAGWVPVFGWWELSGTQLTTHATQAGGAHDRNGTGAIALFGSSSVQDVQASFRAVSATDVYSVLLRAQDVGNCVQFGRYGSSLQLIRFKDGQIAYNQMIDGGAITLPETISAEIRGNTLKGYINGQLKLEYTFGAGELPPLGKVGLQTNHNMATFDQLSTTVYSTGDPGTSGRQVSIDSITLTENFCGPQRLQVRVRDSVGAADVLAVTCADTVTTPSIGTALPLSFLPLRLVSKESATVGVWETPFYSLCEGAHRITANAYDAGDQIHTTAMTLNLTAKTGTYTTVGEKKLFENVDPHPVWRALAADPQPAGVQTFGNYLWQLDWDTDRVRGRALTIEPAATGRPYVGRKVVEESASLGVYPYLRVGGQTLSGPITRHLGDVTSMFGIQPTYEMQTASGKLVWWVRVLNGDPILRFGGTFLASQDVTVACNYSINNGYGSAVTSIKPVSTGWPNAASLTDNYILWRPSGPSEGPVYAWAFNRRPTTSSLSRLAFASVSLKSGQTYELPMLALAVVDAHADYTKLDPATAWAAQLARAALSVPRLQAAYSDLGADAQLCRVALQRPYDFLANDWSLTDGGQLIALPWCAGTNVSATPAPATGLFHTAFGWRPYALTTQPQVTLELPMPALAAERVTPAYEPLSGDWLKKAESCMDQLAAWQLADGTFSGYERMDHYSLARMTLGLTLASCGLKNSPAEQAKARAMVLKSLDRMMGEKKYLLTGNTNIVKGYSGGTEEIAWNAGDPYEPFVYSPKWNQFTEMGAQVDQNLGHAHLLLTLLLYGHYADPEYLKKPAIAEKLKELIKFQWLSQDWNGDIWRVMVGGLDAAGAGDGFEEDLAMLLPRLSEMANLDTPWHTLASRISAMKFGALRQFDYLPVQNEWGYEFLTPMHHPAEWTPEGGWSRQYLGDVWWTGPATCSGIYGPWYADNIYKPIPDIFNHMWYDLLEDPRDTITADARHWLTIGGYCSEAQMGDPFLGAVKLMRAYSIAKQHGYLNSSTRGEWIWNFAFYPAAMTIIQHELAARYYFMNRAEPVDGAATSSSSDQVPAYAWKLGGEAVVSIAAYRLTAPKSVTVQVNGAMLGLSNARWIVTDLKAGTAHTIPAGQALTLQVSPHTSTTVRITPEDLPPTTAVRGWGKLWK